MKDKERNHVKEFNDFCKIARTKLMFGDKSEEDAQDYIHALYLEFREGKTIFDEVDEWIDFIFHDATESEGVWLKSKQ